MASRRGEIEVETEEFSKDWDFDRTTSVDEMAASGVCDKLKEAQRIRKGGGKAVPPSVVGVFRLSRIVLKMRRKNIKLVARVSYHGS